MGMTIKMMSILVLVMSLLLNLIHAALDNDFHSTHKSLKVAKSTTTNEGFHGSDGVVKSIQSEDGDIIDCIDIYKQPAFSHPALRNHKIQMKPSYVPTKDTNTTKVGIPNTTPPTQVWRKSGSCPKGTVPIRRIQRKSPDEWRKPPGFRHSTKPLDVGSGSVNLQQKNHSLTLLIAEGFAYLGAKGDIAIYNPFVEKDDEYSLSQVCLLNGPHDDFEAIEAGTAVNPRVYGDRDTRIYVHWTVDGSKKTGCFDHFCPGFVQVNPEIALGATIRRASSPNAGLPGSDATLYIYKDVNTSNWWVQLGETQNLGYWPGELFSLLSYHAEAVQWGGDVYSSWIGHVRPHTSTAMGSGEYANVPEPNTGLIRRMGILDNSLVLKYPEGAFSFSDEYDCYAFFYSDEEFHYGGFGRSPICP